MNLPDGLWTKPHAVVITEVGNGEADILIGVFRLHGAQGSNLPVEGGEGGVVAALHAAGSVQEDVVDVGLLTHDEWGLEVKDDPTAGPLMGQ